MKKLTSLVSTLDNLLRSDKITDYAGAMNGLQLENSGRITRIIAAVDACEKVILESAAVKGTLLIVHHGIFWKGVERISGPLYRKISVALSADLAIYSSHLPLDLHPQLGNNIQLSLALGIRSVRPALEYKGQAMGLLGTIKPLKRQQFAKLLSKVTGTVVHFSPGGPETIRTVLVVTGSAGGEVIRAAELGVDAFVTGEGPHWSYIAAEERGVNLFYGGHYATETFGVKALAAHLSKQCGLPWSFIDHPTGL